MTDYHLVLHLDSEGCVWTGRPGGFLPSRTTHTPLEFLAATRLVGEVRVLGSRQNAPLICALRDEMARRPEELKVLLGTPRLIPRGATVQDTIHAAANEPRHPVSLGGWRPLTDADYISYALSETATIGSDAIHCKLAVLHPIWPLAQFIPTMTPVWFGRWVGQVLDPRWYINREKPDRDAPLQSHLGLRPEVFKQCLEGRLDTAQNWACWTTYCCWMPATIEEAKAVDLAHPRNFLFRIFGAHVSKDRAVAAVRASQMCVSYLRGLWLNSLSVGQIDPLFSPEHFFRRPEELEAFQEFQAGL